MDDAVFCQSIEFMPRYTLNCFWLPVGTHIGKYLSGAGELVTH